MDLRKLKTLIDLVSESNIAELEITEAEGKVRIVKSGPAVAGSAGGAALSPPAAALPPLVVAAPGVPAGVGGAAAAAAPPAGEALARATDKVIKSPMVGTFYRAASPGAKAFVDVGDTVAEGQPVCIIEAMKIMNEIESDCAGRVMRVLCENGQAVEFGQPLFVVE